MTLKSYILGMRFLTLAAIGVFLWTLIAVDPESSGIGGKLIFYAALFFSLSGIFNLFLSSVRKKFMGPEMALANLGISFRQGILLSILTVGILVLQSFRFLVWWDGLLTVGAIFLVELYFLSRN